MSMVRINWHPKAKELRRFGVVVIIGLALIGLFVQFVGDNLQGAIALYAAAALLGLPALTGWKVALPGYWLWMGIAFVAGNIISRVALTLIYLLLFTPLGLLRRILGSDRLHLRYRITKSYWCDTAPSGQNSKDYQRLF